ncbi:MAG: oligosaccharide repeat unit polymerase [Gemmatimonadaceae bacterium]|nr:oligosaccharide repeat unit polymerase [Gemmatimonadaceae bacterium]
MIGWLTFTALVLSIVLVAWAAFMRAVCGSWLHPAALFPMWWCFAGILPLIFAPYDPVSAGAMAWVIAAAIAVSLGAVVGNIGFKTRLRLWRPPATKMEQQMLSLIVVVAILLGLASSVAFALGSGIGLRDFLDIQRLVVVSNQLYVARYAEPDAVAVAPPRFSQALLPFVYLAPAVGGALFVIHRKWRWKMIAVASMLPAITVTVLQTTKAAVLFSFSLWFASYLATRLRLGKIGLFTRAHLSVGFVLGGIATVFFFAVGLARLASTDVALLDVVRVKLVTAAFGHMSVFSQWLGDYWNAPFNPTLGEFTFAGPRELLGIQQRVPGVFGTVVDLIAGETSNIFTGFRPLIQDFTIPGALTILALLGLVGGIAYRLVAIGRWEAVPVLVGAYVTIMWTPITWFWIYNSLTATVFALAIIIWVLRTWRRARGRIYIEAGEIIN